MNYDEVARDFVAQSRANQSYYVDPTPFNRVIAEVGRRGRLARRLWEEGTAVSAELASAVYRLRDCEETVFTLPVVIMELESARALAYASRSASAAPG